MISRAVVKVAGQVFGGLSGAALGLLPGLLSGPVAQVPPVDVGPTTIVPLIGNLGSVGGALLMAYFFISYLKDVNVKQKEMVDDFKAAIKDLQESQKQQMKEYADRQKESQQAFQDQIQRLTASQNDVLRDAIVAMKSVEKTVDGSAGAIRSVEKTVDGLGTAVKALDLLVRETLNSGRSTGVKMPPNLGGPPP